MDIALTHQLILRAGITTTEIEYMRNLKAMQQELKYYMDAYRQMLLPSE